MGYLRNKIDEQVEVLAVFGDIALDKGKLKILPTSSSASATPRHASTTRKAASR